MIIRLAFICIYSNRDENWAHVMINQWIQGYHSFRQPKWVIEATLGMPPGNKIQDAWDPKKTLKKTMTFKLKSHKSHFKVCYMLIYFDP